MHCDLMALPVSGSLSVFLHRLFLSVNLTSNSILASALQRTHSNTIMESLTEKSNNVHRSVLWEELVPELTPLMNMKPFMRSLFKSCSEI